jgi:nucleoid DNA-binding protein
MWHYSVDFAGKTARFSTPDRWDGAKERSARSEISFTGGNMAKSQKWTASTFTSLVYEQLTKKGTKVKKSELNAAIQNAFEAAVAAGAKGQRVRFPSIGAMAWREVKARKAGKGRNPFTGEEIMLKARPASRKPRWSFPKAVKDAYTRSFRKAA